MAKRKKKKASARSSSTLQAQLEALGLGGDIDWTDPLIAGLSNRPVPPPLPPPGWGWVWNQPTVQIAVGLELVRLGLAQLQKRSR